MQLTGHEVIWRPNDLTSVLRDNGNSHGYTETAADVAWTNGSPTVNASLSSAVNPNVYGIAIAWKGIPATAQCLQINLVKAINLELAPSGNAIESTFAGSASLEEGSEPIDHITSWLDKATPHWQSRAINTAVNVAGSLAKAYTQNIGISRAMSGLRGRQPLRIQNW